MLFESIYDANGPRGFTVQKADSNEDIILVLHEALDKKDAVRELIQLSSAHLPERTDTVVIRF